MIRDATLDPNNLIDSLVDVIDDLRGSLHPQFGVRPFRVYTVLRQWTGGMVGAGDFIDTIVELTPQPRVHQWDGYKWVLLAAGTHEDGKIRLTEVSLRYTYSEIAPSDMQFDSEKFLRNRQFFYVLADAYGQQSKSRYLRVSKPPFPDREKDIGWVVDLMDMNIERGKDPDLSQAAI
jgi:hypothetical protein